jgi:hypothetical protein
MARPPRFCVASRRSQRRSAGDAIVRRCLNRRGRPPHIQGDGLRGSERSANSSGEEDAGEVKRSFDLPDLCRRWTKTYPSQPYCVSALWYCRCRRRGLRMARATRGKNTPCRLLTSSRGKLHLRPHATGASSTRSKGICASLTLGASIFTRMSDGPDHRIGTTPVSGFDTADT